MFLIKVKKAASVAFFYYHRKPSLVGGFLLFEYEIELV
jgi:hypothetical protein